MVQHCPQIPRLKTRDFWHNIIRESRGSIRNARFVAQHCPQIPRSKKNAGFPAQHYTRMPRSQKKRKICGTTQSANHAVKKRRLWYNIVRKFCCRKRNAGFVTHHHPRIPRFKRRDLWHNIIHKSRGRKKMWDLWNNNVRKSRVSTMQSIRLFLYMSKMLL